jgi:hypothetical protein
LREALAEKQKIDQLDGDRKKKEAQVKEKDVLIDKIQK